MKQQLSPGPAEWRIFVTALQQVRIGGSRIRGRGSQILMFRLYGGISSVGLLMSARLHLSGPRWQTHILSRTYLHETP